MPSLRQIASSARMQTRVALFGNNHSFKINMRYASYENAARRSWKARSKATPDRVGGRKPVQVEWIRGSAAAGPR